MAFNIEQSLTDVKNASIREANALARRLGNAGVIPNRGLAPITTIKTTHALLVRFGGKTLGAGYEFSWNISQEVDESFEIHKNARGLPRELLAQKVSGRTLTIGRFDLYRSTFGQFFSQPSGKEVTMLNELRYGLRLYEAWISPSGVFANGSDVFEFSPVMFKSEGRTLKADDDRIVRANVTAVFGRRRKVT